MFAINNTLRIALVGALCALPSLAVACSCKAPPAPKIALEKAAAVFIGRVTSVEKTGDYSNKFQFAVSKKWKGVEGNSTSIVSSSTSAACGIVFDTNRDYLVYAYKTEGNDQLLTNLCTRTKRVADADDDLTELGAPVAANLAVGYPVKNGEVQINAGSAQDPLTPFVRALQNDEKTPLFRVNWSAPTGDDFHGTALYNRADSTLKVYSRAQTDGKVSVESVLYSGVTDEVLTQLAASENLVEFFNKFADYGVTRRDLGSKTVRITS